MFLSVELDHFVKDLFKVFEVFSFLDWTVGALAKKIKDFSDLAGDIASDCLGVLSCADKAIADGPLELAALFSLGLLKKRKLWCSFTTKSHSDLEIGSFVFAI